MNTKKVSLITKFIKFFVIFIAVTIALTAILTYYLQTNIYQSQYQSQLSQINDYILASINTDLEDFANVQSYFAEHSQDLKIPFKYSDNIDNEWLDFDSAFKKEYPDKIWERDVKFNDLSENVKFLYVRYAYKNSLLMFDRIRDRFGLDYAYYVYPTENDGEMCFMFDGPREEKIIDGESLLDLGICAKLDRKKYANMWKSFETAKPTGIMDAYENEFGHEYTYSTPVIYNGKVLGMILIDVNYNWVESIVYKNTSIASFLYLLILGICSAFMIAFVRKNMLLRITKLENDVTDYAEKKDPAIAQVIITENKIHDEIGSLSDEFSDMIIQLNNYMNNLAKITAEKERIGAELNVATKIQASMLPRIFPPFPDREEFSLFASMDPAKEVGGDFYDFFMIDDNHVALVIADVSGKGVPAALFMAIAKVLLKDNAQANNDPATILFNTNEQLCDVNDAELFVTVWLGIVDITTGVLTFSDAGHEYPVLLHENGNTELIQPAKKRPPVATMNGIKYMNKEIVLKKGDTLFLYTDGVPEATNNEDKLYGMERLEEILRKNSKTDVNALLPAVRADVDEFVKGAEQFDDITMLALRLEEI